MTLESTQSAGLEDPRVVEALDAYTQALESGQTPDRQALLAQFPDLAGPLVECLESLEALHAGGSPVGHRPVLPGTGMELTLGAPLGDFRLIREIGRGGMGIVYEAEQLSLGRRVALKVLAMAWALDPRQLQRFKNEARAAATLHHTNIVPIHAVGVERGVHFYAMQYIEGQSLAEWIACLRRATGKEPGSPVSPSAETLPPSLVALATANSTDRALYFKTCARMGIQAAEALDYAHQYGVVHRDVKPGNLLLDPQGTLLVADFGLAQFQTEAALTFSGELLGTLRYMSPEQAEGKRNVADPRSDVYSLGVTLYELITLEPAFGGQDRAELIRQVLFEDPRPLRQINPAIPAALETIALKAMARQVEDRYATAGELAEDLRRFLEDRPILARRPSLSQKVAHWCRRHRTLVGAGIVLLFLTAVGFAVSTALIAREQVNTQAAYTQLAQEEARTREANARLAQEKARAEQAYEAEVQNFRQAERMLDFFVRVSGNELPDKPWAQDVRRRLLLAALAYYQDLIDRSQQDPVLVADLEARYQRVASLLGAQHRSGYFRFLGSPVVRAELGLTPKQTEEASALAGSFYDTFRTFDPGREPAWKGMQGLTRSGETFLASLTSQQLQRLRQIQLQRLGAYAFLDNDVTEFLRLTTQQQTAIEMLHRESRASGSEQPALGPILALLTTEQVTRWQELIGPPFTGDLTELPPEMLPGGPPGPPPPHGHRGPGGPGGLHGPGGPGEPGRGRGPGGRPFGPPPFKP